MSQEKLLLCPVTPATDREILSGTERRVNSLPSVAGTGLCSIGMCPQVRGVNAYQIIRHLQTLPGALRLETRVGVLCLISVSILKPGGC